MEIRLIAEGEEELCNEFYNRIHGKSRTMNQWRWEFASNNYDKTPIPYAVVADGSRIVGTQAFIPIRMIDRGGVFWTAKSEETLVDPEYRGQKLFEKMYSLLFDYAREHKFASVWGFTPAIKAFVRLGFDIPTETKQLFMPYSGRSISALMKRQTGPRRSALSKLSLGVARTAGLAAQVMSSIRLASNRRRTISGLDIRTMEVPDDQCAEVSRRFIDKYGGITIYRDREYVRWRLFENPYVKSVIRSAYDGDKLLGWAAFTIGDDGLGYLVDVFVAGDSTTYRDEDVIRMLLIEAAIGTRDMGATGIRGWSVNSHEFDRLVSRAARGLGFYLIKRGHAMVIYECEAGKQRESHRKGDDWFVTRVFTEGVFG